MPIQIEAAIFSASQSVTGDSVVRKKKRMTGNIQQHTDLTNKISI
jgi:hypothetical protein